MEEKKYDVGDIECQKDELINYLNPLNRDFLKKLSNSDILSYRDLIFDKMLWIRDLINDIYYDIEDDDGDGDVDGDVDDDLEQEDVCPRV